MPDDRMVIYCDCVYSEHIPSDTRRAVRSGLVRAGVPFEAVPDLCEWAATRSARLKDWTRGASLTVIACFPRAVRGLLHAGGVPVDNGVELTCLNMLTQSPEEILATVLSASHPTRDVKAEPEIRKDGDWVPWFPVIDYDRCRTCKL